ncbi:FimB/Mfa2 family fimbrial subunit [Parabacteroides sp. APC149_11_2_Y6]
MKKGKIFTNCLLSIFTIIATISFASCSADNDVIVSNGTNEVVTNSIEAPFSVILKAYSENKDITADGDVENTTLFVFDENNDFYQQLTISKDYLLQGKAVDINCPGLSKITVVAWAGISDENEEISSMNQANIISDLQVSLKHNNGIASNFPSDLFYGQATISRPATKAVAQELKIERKVASISLLTKGIIKVYDSTEGDFYYKIKKTKSSFNCNGELTGSDVEYIIPATINENGYLISKKAAILPSSDIVVELYKDGNLILSSEKSQNSEIVPVNEGEQATFIFDLSKKNYSLTVSPWSTASQYVTI